jgi:hypothetical protein
MYVSQRKDSRSCEYLKILQIQIKAVEQKFITSHIKNGVFDFIKQVIPEARAIESIPCCISQYQLWILLPLNSRCLQHFSRSSLARARRESGVQSRPGSNTNMSHGHLLTVSPFQPPIRPLSAFEPVDCLGLQKCGLRIHNRSILQTISRSRMSFVIVNIWSDSRIKTKNRQAAPSRRPLKIEPH